MYGLYLSDPAIKEAAGWSIGQQCQAKEHPGVWEIVGFNQYGGEGYPLRTMAYLAKLKKDGTKNGKGTDINIDDLLPLGAVQPDKDKDGFTAAEYAGQIFAAGFAKRDWYNTSKQSLVKVLSISPTGRIKVGEIKIKRGVTPRVESTINKRKVYSQEEKLINFANLDYELDGKTKTFTPRLYNGEWGFWRGGEYIAAPTMKIIWLND